MKSNADYLKDMLEYVRRIEQIAREGEDSFNADFMRQDAVIRQYEVIGEIAKRLPPELLATVSSVNWSQIKGFRDFLAHNYDKVDLDVVWSAIQKIAELRAAVQTMLDNLPPEQADADSK